MEKIEILQLTVIFLPEDGSKKRGIKYFYFDCKSFLHMFESEILFRFFTDIIYILKYFKEEEIFEMIENKYKVYYKINLLKWNHDKVTL